MIPRTEEEQKLWLIEKARKEQERIDRIRQEWPEKNYPIEVAKFSSRIVRVLSPLSCPRRKKIESCYIFGQHGSGKTIKAAQMILGNLFYTSTEEGPSEYIFTSVLKIMVELRASYNHLPEQSTEKEILEKYSNIPILVLDDIGAEKTSDWTYQSLLYIIQERYEEDRITVFTSNYDLNELAELLQDSRIPDRIQEMGCIVKMKDRNYRATNQK